MAPRPIFCVTHPRAISTAFERVFMTRRDTLQCVHEPFGDAFYYGPEFMSERFAEDAKTRIESGFLDSKYSDIVDSISQAGQEEGKRVFIKDMAYYIIAPNGKRTSIAPSLGGGVEAGNPTVIPMDVLRRFSFTFLIRHPSKSIPSYWRCTIPPLSDINGFDHFMPSEAGYEELVRMFDFLVNSGLVDREQLIVIDADDMLADPEGTIREYCRKTDIDFKDSMLNWNDDDKKYAEEHFAKWNGFHNDAINTSVLQKRAHSQKQPTVEAEDEEWTKKYGPEAQRVIRATVDANIPHYEYLKQFCIKP